MAREQLAPAQHPARPLVRRCPQQTVSERDQLAAWIARGLQPVAEDQVAGVIERRGLEQRLELVASGHGTSYRRRMPPVLVSWDWHGDETVHILSETYQTILGGPAHEIDLGDGPAAQAWLVDGPAGWLVGRHEDGSETPLEHGDRFTIRRHRFQFLLADDVTRALDEDRYLRTVMDPLTNVFNRRFFFVHTARLAPAALLMLDLDQFMSFNDQHGHVAGDIVLQQLAARLRDSLTWPELIVRYGGEEFLVILPGASLAEALVRAEGLRQLADEPLDIEGEAPVVTISIGVALIGTGNDALNDALRGAGDNLMYAKERGRNRVVG